MKSIRIIFTTVAFTGLIAGAAYLAPGLVKAYQGNPDVKGPNYTDERHAAMEQAMAKQDYQAWKTLMAGRGRASQVVTPENFAQFVQAHELAEAGKLEEAAAIRAKLGLGSGQGMGQGGGAGRQSGAGARGGCMGYNQ